MGWDDGIGTGRWKGREEIVTISSSRRDSRIPGFPRRRVVSEMTLCDEAAIRRRWRGRSIQQFRNLLRSIEARKRIESRDGKDEE